MFKFEEYFKNNDNEWLIKDTPKVSYKIENNSYIFEHKRDEGTWYSSAEIKGINWKENYLIEIEIENIYTPKSEGFGLIWNITDNSEYDFLISSNGYYKIYKYENKWTTIKDWKKTEAINQGNNINRLKVIKKNFIICFYINDILVYELNYNVFHKYKSNLLGFTIPNNSKVKINHVIVENFSGNLNKDNTKNKENYIIEHEYSNTKTIYNKKIKEIKEKTYDINQFNEFICPECSLKNKSSNKNCSSCNSKLIINDRYFLITMLGSNTGTTYLSYDTKSKKKVIIKEFDLKNSNKWKSLESLKKEGEILSQLDYPLIPKLKQHFSIDTLHKKNYYIVMQYIKGKTLREEFKSKRYTRNEVIDIIISISRILSYLHNLVPPIIHRDIKLSNLIRNENGDIVLIDFGSVKETIKAGEYATVTGTFGFMAPEQLKGISIIENDFYSLGVVAVVLLTRKEPEEMMDDEGININWQKYVQIDKNLQTILNGLLQVNPKKRLNNADYLITTMDNLKQNKNIDHDKAVRQNVDITDNELITLYDKTSKIMPTKTRFIYLPRIIDTILIVLGFYMVYYFHDIISIILFAIFLIYISQEEKIDIKFKTSKIQKIIKEISEEKNEELAIQLIEYWIRINEKTYTDNDNLNKLFPKIKEKYINKNKLDSTKIELYENFINSNETFLEHIN